MELCLWEAAPAPLALSLYSCNADSWMPTQEEYLDALFPQEKAVGLHTVPGCSQGCPTYLCHRAVTPRATGTPVATGEWDQSWDMIQKQTSATRVWDKRELVPSPAWNLGTRWVWKGRLSLRIQFCRRRLSKSHDSSKDSSSSQH